MAREVTPSTSPDARAVRDTWADSLGRAGLHLLRLAIGTAGGDMAVESSPGAGTCVTITLPPE